MTRSLSFFYFLCALCLATLSSGCSRNSLNESADKNFALAVEAVRHDRLADAERLFREALPLYAQADNPDRFNEATAALADCEQRRGKFSDAFAHFHAARSYFESRQNATQIVSISTALADLYARIGSRDSAFLLTAAALRASNSLGNDAGKAATEFELGRIELIFHNPGAAVAHFSLAARYASTLSNARLSTDVAAYCASALADLDRRDEAVRQIQIATQSAASLKDPILNVQLHSTTGAVFLRLGLFEDALREFREGLKGDSAAVSGMDVQLMCGIGEVFFANYAHANAREYYSKAYNRALTDENAAVMGFCLMRMAECEEREALHSPSASAVLRSATLFQQATSLFNRDVSPQRTALALAKQAELRAAFHEDADADPLFLSAFTIMRTAAIQSFPYENPSIITNTSRLLPHGASHDDWWYRPYASFLLRKRHIGSALATVSEGEAASMRHTIQGYPIAFQDTVRNSAVSTYLSNQHAASIVESELMARQMLTRAMKDEPNGDSLQIRFRALQSDLSNQSSFIQSRYPSLLPLTPAAKPVSFESIQQRVPADGTLISYISLGGRFYAVIVPGRANILAVDLGAEGPIKERIGQYCSLLQSSLVRIALGQKPDEADLRQLSLQLASQLIQPIESHISRRLVIHTSEEIMSLPFHALLLPGGAIAGKTHEISYAPVLNSPGIRTAEPQLRNVVVFGAPSTGSLESEYELRSVKNFFPGASVLVTQSATEKYFREVSGDVLHLSTYYGSDQATDRSLFALSGGSITAPEAYRPISAFLLTRPFGMWVIADLRRDSSMTSAMHAVFAMMSGATRCVLQRFSCPSPAAKEFNEIFYTSLLAHGDGKTAYRDALMQLQQKHASDAALFTAPFFMMEW